MGVRERLCASVCASVGDCDILKLQFMPAPAFPASAIVMMAHFYCQTKFNRVYRIISSLPPCWSVGVFGGT